MKLLASARNARGPLSPQMKRKVREYLLNPTPDGWRDIRCAVIRWDRRVSTIWQALVAFEPRWHRAGVVPSGGDDTPPTVEDLPDAITLAHAIKSAVDGGE